MLVQSFKKQVRMYTLLSSRTKCAVRDKSVAKVNGKSICQAVE